MAATKKKRIKLLLRCENCSKREKENHQNYLTSRTKKEGNVKLSLKKYCKFCRQTSLHQEIPLKRQ